MKYVVYHTKTLRPVKSYYYWKSAAKRLAKLGAGHSVTDIATFMALPVPTRTVRSLMTGAEIEIPVDTPHCCDPSTETYWSM
jgi:hypothetical protein